MKRADIRKVDSEFMQFWLRQNVELNRHLFGVIVGKTGFGKSYAAIRLGETHAELMKVPFKIDNIVFSVLDFLKLLDTIPRYSTIIFDDAGQEYNNQDWYTETVKIVGKTLQSFRELAISVFMTIPDQSYLPREAKDMPDIKIIMKYPGKGKAYYTEKNHNNQKVYKHTLEKLQFRLPQDKDFIKAYEAKKSGYLFEKRQLDIGKLLANEQKEKEQALKGVPEKEIIKQMVNKGLERFIDKKGNLSAHLIGLELEIRDNQKCYRLKAGIESYHLVELNKAIQSKKDFIASIA